MKLGIDFGTTGIVVAVVDRGNYPILAFEDTEGNSHEWFPPVVAVRGAERLYGWEAWAVQADPAYTMVRSIKRTLEDAGPGTMVEIGSGRISMQQLLDEMVLALKRALLEKSSLPGKRDDVLEVMLGVPANANSNQRFLTVDPFQRAGFSVLGLLNEPSAASIEYGHLTRGTATPELLLVYDLGGGTFDSSLVDIDGKTHAVIASEGVSTLGGDDFDALLAEMALSAAKIPPAEREKISQAAMFRLSEECRLKKETLHPNSRRVIIDLGVVQEDWPEVSIPADEFYAECRPLLEQTTQAVDNLLQMHSDGRRVDAVYVTGGGSELPLVTRVLKETFGRRVKRSPHTRGATAIGLAIQANAQEGYVLRETFSRHFGVWREADEGRRMVFDPLFPKGTALPRAGDPALWIARSYHPVHNIGHFRYLECSQRGNEGRPAGDIAVWDEIRFPFDPVLRDKEDLQSASITLDEISARQHIEEHYECDAGGSVTVEIRNLTANYSRRFRLGKWAGKSRPIIPGKRGRGAARQAAQ